MLKESSTGMIRTCRNCNNSFLIGPDDLAFLAKMSPRFDGKIFDLPPPTLCPGCRYQRRLSFRNERTLYQRNSNFSGKPIISIYSPINTSTIYSQSEWWGDSWDGTTYGREFDFSKTFTEQFAELLAVVPRPAITNHNSENSDYTNQSENNKNCYFLTSSSNNQECLYGHWIQSCRSCVDCLLTEKSELCYQCINITQCYDSEYLENCSGCSSCAFCYDCRGCDSCIGCFGLQNKSYYLFNKPSSKEEIQQFKATHLNSYRQIESIKKSFQELLTSHPRKYYVGFNNEHSVGDYLQGTKNAFWCFNCRDSEDVSYCTDAWQEKLCMDLTEILDDVSCYEMHGSAYNHDSMFCSLNWHVYNNFYCDLMFSSHDCFGSAGLKHKEYCVFNTQYKKNEYESLVAKIISHMIETKEWGEFLNPALSRFGYNESVAKEYFPLSKEEAQKLYYRWSEYESPPIKIQNLYRASELPDSIQDVDAVSLETAVECENTKKPFRITQEELRFYRKKGIPLPRINQEERHLQRMAKRNPRSMNERACSSCNQELLSTYPKTTSLIILCEKCYQQKIYQ